MEERQRAEEVRRFWGGGLGSDWAGMEFSRRKGKRGTATWHRETKVSSIIQVVSCKHVVQQASRGQMHSEGHSWEAGGLHP